MAEHETEGRYRAQLLEMIRADKTPTALGLHIANVYHDDWCAIFSGGMCNCEPTIQIGDQVRAL